MISSPRYKSLFLLAYGMETTLLRRNPAVIILFISQIRDLTGIEAQRLAQGYNAI